MYTAIGNSAGTSRTTAKPSAECSITMTAPDSSGWVKAQAVKAPRSMLRNWLNAPPCKATMSANPQEIDPGKYTVILEPAAALDMIGTALVLVCRYKPRRQTLVPARKARRRVFGDNVTFLDDVMHETSRTPFDGEEVCLGEASALVEDGVVKNFVYGRRSAKRSSANALPGMGFPSQRRGRPIR